MYIFYDKSQHFWINDEQIIIHMFEQMMNKEFPSEPIFHYYICIDRTHNQY